MSKRSRRTKHQRFAERRFRRHGRHRVNRLGLDHLLDGLVLLNGSVLRA